jgi:hypothetical protein
MSQLAVYSVFLAATMSYPNNLFARMPELKCKEWIDLPDYDNPLYTLAKKLGGECPEGFDEIEWEGSPCRKFLGFATKKEEIPVECPKRGRRSR